MILLIEAWSRWAQEFRDLQSVRGLSSSGDSLQHVRGKDDLRASLVDNQTNAGRG